MSNRLSIVVAHDKNRAIGYRGELPWRGKLPADMARFRQLTVGHTVLMGRRTYESIGRPLPQRRNVVLTRQIGALLSAGIEKVHSFEEARDLLADDPEVFVIGGAQIYQLAMPYVRSLHVTTIHATFEGDAFFPELPADQWTASTTENHTADSRNAYNYSFTSYERST